MKKFFIMIFVMLGISFGANYVIRPTSNINLDTVNVLSPSTFTDSLKLVDTVSLDTTIVLYNLIMSFSKDTINDSSTLALFNFNEGSGNTTLDSKNGIIGSTSNITWTALSIGYAATFNGTNSYITTNSSLLLNIKDTFSVDIIFKLPTTSSRRTIFGMRGREDLSSEIGADGKIRANINGNVLVGSARVDDNLWHSLTITHKKPNSAIYVDGVVDASISTPTLKVNNISNILFGSLNLQEFPSSFFFNGSIDLIRFSRTQRSQAEITKIYNLSQRN